MYEPWYVTKWNEPDDMSQLSKEYRVHGNVIVNGTTTPLNNIYVV